MVRSVPIEQHLKNKSDPVPECGCIIWMGYVGLHGYGVLWVDGKQETTHRLAWRLRHGTIPNGLHVLHRCDIRTCINPDHLFLGTQRDNVADMDAKKRRRVGVGEKHRSARLKEHEVRAIRMDSRNDVAIAKEYGVWPSVIWKIRNNKTWRHL